MLVITRGDWGWAAGSALALRACKSRTGITAQPRLGGALTGALGKALSLSQFAFYVNRTVALKTGRNTEIRLAALPRSHYYELTPHVTAICEILRFHIDQPDTYATYPLWKSLFHAFRTERQGREKGVLYRSGRMIEPEQGCGDQEVEGGWKASEQSANTI